MKPLNTLRCTRLTAAMALAWAAAPIATGAQTLSEVVVTANREAQQSFDAPAAIQGIGRETIEAAGPQVNLSEAINRIPGVTVLNRQNYAQDLQLSIRGSGSRAPFGIRGARLIVDGIPATMPDGQGQASTISLPSAERIEVLRGPLAQLYGNSSAGVLQVFTADGPERPELRTSVDLGSEGLRRYGLQAAGQSGALNYVVDVSDFQTDGWRVNSAAERQHLNAKLRWTLSEQTRLTLVANVFDQPVSGDPLGLTREQWHDVLHALCENLLACTRLTWGDACSVDPLTLQHLLLGIIATRELGILFIQLGCKNFVGLNNRPARLAGLPCNRRYDAETEQQTSRSSRIKCQR